MSGLAGLDRKAMEAERLARVRKRERSISPPPTRDATKAARVEESSTTLPSGAIIKTFSTLVSEDQRGRKSDSANAASTHLSSPAKAPKLESVGDEKLLPGSVRFPRGVIKKTWAFGFERTGDDIKLEEVLETSTLKTAVLSAFQWNTEWIQAKLKIPPEGVTRCYFVMQAKEESLRQQMREQVADMKSFLRLCLPSMSGQINCMHSKLMLLFHEKKLRIAIPTANLLDFDWGETGVMENSVFIIDLPRLEKGEKPTRLNAFCSELLFYLDKQGLDKDVRDGVLNFDFAATDNMAFIHTVGGSNTGEDAQRTGLPGLARAVRQLNLHSTSDLQLDFAASSIGSLSNDQLSTFHAACRGEDMIQRASAATAKAKTDFFKASASKASSSAGKMSDKLRIYFPTHDTVRASKAGAAGTICINRKWWEDMKFPRSCFRDYQSVRQGLLSHNKILYARGKQVGSDGRKKDIAWGYVGSANMSESAWGKMVFDKKTKSWTVSARNWECGVLLPAIADDSNGERPAKVARDDSETESEDEGGEAASSIVGMEVFDKVFRPPFEIPGKEYGDREPWYFQEYRDSPIYFAGPQLIFDLTMENLLLGALKWCSKDDEEDLKKLEESEQAAAAERVYQNTRAYRREVEQQRREEERERGYKRRVQEEDDARRARAEEREARRRYDEEREERARIQAESFDRGYRLFGNADDRSRRYDERRDNRQHEEPRHHRGYEDSRGGGERSDRRRDQGRYDERRYDDWRRSDRRHDDRRRRDR